MITIYKFIGKNGKSYELDDEEIKLNYRCKKEEQNGEGPGSCGGSKGSENMPKDVETRKKGYLIAKEQLGMTDEDAIEYATKYSDKVNKMKREELTIRNKATKAAKLVGLTDKNDIDKYVKKYIQSSKNQKRHK